MKSNRAFSRKNRVYAMREFILETFGDILTSNPVEGSDAPQKCTILDVAGGKGILSWVLSNIDAIDSIVVDPRRTDYANLMKSVNYLQEHPIEAEERCIRNLPTFQPLAACLKLKKGRSKNNQNVDGGNMLTFTEPRHLRMYLDADLIEAINRVKMNKEEDFDSKEVTNDWEVFWSNATSKAENSCPIYGSKQNTQIEPLKESHHDRGRITDPEEVLSLFLSKNTKLIIGFHPDQATEPIVDLALLLKMPFVICPCCVFPSEFPNRFLPLSLCSTNSKIKLGDLGMRVRTYSEFIQYLQTKHKNIRTGTIDMLSYTARNIVLYMLPEDFL